MNVPELRRLLGELFPASREFASAAERAEEVGRVLVPESSGSGPGVDRHPPDRIDRQSALGCLALPDGGHQFDRVTDVAQGLSSAGLVQNAVYLRSEGDGLCR